MCTQSIKQEDRPFRSSGSIARRLGIVLCLFLVALSLSACRESARGARGQASGLLSINSLSANLTTAHIGDNIVVRWNYANPGQLNNQSFRLLGLTINGISVQTQNLPREQREISFPFSGPVTVVITAQDRGNRLTDAAFDINLASEYSFTMDGVRSSRLGYPRIGEPTGGGEIDLQFSQFFGVYEVADLDGNGNATIEDGVIDGLAQFGRVLPPGESFFGHSFSVEERDQFGFRLGSGFPLLDPGYLLTADGSQFFGVRTTADIVVFAGKIAYDGRPARDRKSGLRYRRNIGQFEPLFATIDIRTDNQGIPHVADVDLGNTNQGLTVSVFRGGTLFRELGTTLVNYNVNQLGAVGEISGSIKGSRLGFGVTRSNGTILTSMVGGVEVPGVFVNVNGIDWNVPFHPDTNLSGLQ
jgi:hypothetical protein